MKFGYEEHASLRPAITIIDGTESLIQAGLL
jgi:hypothetical protein